MASTPFSSVALTDGRVQGGPDADRERYRLFLRAAAASPEAARLLRGVPGSDSALRHIAAGGFLLRRVNTTVNKVALKS